MNYKEKLKRNSRKLVLITTAASIIIAMLDFCGPLVIKDFIDNFQARNMRVSLLFIAAIYFFNYLVKIALSAFVSWYEEKFKTREMLQLFRIMFSMKYEELIALEPTYLVEKINTSVSTLFSLYSEAISNFCVAVVTIGVSILLMCRVNWGIACVFLVLIPIQIIGYKKLNQKLSELCMKLQTICAKYKHGTGRVYQSAEQCNLYLFRCHDAAWKNINVGFYLYFSHQRPVFSGAF